MSCDTVLPFCVKSLRKSEYDHVQHFDILKKVCTMGLFGCLVGWLVGWLVGGLVGWLVCLFVNLRLIAL